MGSTSANAFDPLAQWLGIPTAEQPPHHYRLLGLKLFEDRAEKIEQAADERMAAVRKHQNGPRAAATQKVLNRLAAAKQCLLNPATRGAYDAAIQGQLAADKSAAQKSAASGKRLRAVEQPPAFDLETPPIDPALDFAFDNSPTRADASATQEGTAAHIVARRRTGRPLMWPSIALTIFTACAGAWVLFGRDNDRGNPEKPPIVIVKPPPGGRSTTRSDAPPIVRPDGGTLRCTADNVAPDDAHRRVGDVLDMTLLEGRVEVSWTVRIRKAGFYAASITYSAAGEAAQTFEIELAAAANATAGGTAHPQDTWRRTTPIRPTAGQFATDEFKTVVFRKTGDHRVVLRAAGTVDRTRKIDVRSVQFRPISLPSP